MICINVHSPRLKEIRWGPAGKVGFFFTFTGDAVKEHC